MAVLKVKTSAEKWGTQFEELQKAIADCMGGLHRDHRVLSGEKWAWTRDQNRVRPVHGAEPEMHVDF